MMYRFFLILIVLSVSSQLFAQSWDEVRKLKSVYLCGEGYGETVREADQAALADLVSQISLIVSSNQELLEDERITNNSAESNSYFKQKVQSHSEAMLTSTQKVVLSDEPDAHVGRFVKRSEVDKIFAARRSKMMEYIVFAKQSEQQGRVDDALRGYYWAFSMLKTLPHPNAEKDGEGHVLSVWLPNQMSAIFKDIKVDVVAVHGGSVDLSFVFRGKPVASLDYTFSTGRDWSAIYSAKNGRGVLELPTDLDRVRLKFEYAYESQAHTDHEVQPALAAVKGRALKDAYYNLVVKAPSSMSAQPVSKPADNVVSASSSSASLPTTSSGASSAHYSREAAAMSKLLKALALHRHDEARSLFTSDGQAMFDSLVSYGTYRLLDTSQVRFYPYGSRVVARSVPMAFSFKRGVRKSFVEDVVFTFNEQGMIESLAFGLDAETTADILSRQAYSPEARQVIVSFLETYKTAYAFQRLDYIESIFADDAIIIVGNVVKRMERSAADQMKYAQNRYVIKTKYSKQQYIKNLANCFRRNEYVNLRLSAPDVTKAGAKGAGETYGLQMRQDYYSMHYGDVGYLYLQVDLNNPDKPVITVRTWQEEPDPDLGHGGGLYGMADF